MGYTLGDAQYIFIVFFCFRFRYIFNSGGYNPRRTSELHRRQRAVEPRHTNLVREFDPGKDKNQHNQTDDGPQGASGRPRAPPERDDLRSNHRTPMCGRSSACFPPNYRQQ